MKKKEIHLLSLILIFIISQTDFAVAQWSGLGNGLNGQVSAIVEFQNELYVGGKFTANGTNATTLNHIAKWNGTSWSAVGSGFDEEVKTFVVFNNQLYAGGTFTHSGATALNHVAKLSGGTWVDVAQGFNSNVNALYVFQDALYAGGAFSQSGATAVNKIAKLVSNSWTNPNNTIVTGEVKAIAQHLGNLYIGGFPFGVLRMDAATWTSIGALSGQVYAMGSFQYQSSTTKYLYIGGDFTVAPSFGLCVQNGSSYATPFNQYLQPSKSLCYPANSDQAFYRRSVFSKCNLGGASQTRVSTTSLKSIYYSLGYYVCDILSRCNSFCSGNIR